MPIVTPEDLRLGLWQARLLVLVAALLWSTSGFFVKAPYLKGWPGPVLACWRAAFACLLLWPMVRRVTWSWKLIPMTLAFAAMNFAFLTSMAMGSAGNAIWLQCTSQVWILLAGVLVFHEPAVLRDWWLVGFSAAGIGLILGFESRGAGLEAVGWGLASSVFYAMVVLSLRNLRSFDAAWLGLLNHLVTAMVLLPFALDDGHVPTGIQWLMLGGLGMLQMGLPYLLFSHSLRRLPGHEAAGISLLEPLLVPVWVWLAWGDQADWWTLAGGGLILLGLVVRYVGR